MQHYLMLSSGNFCGEKQHSNKALPFGTRGSIIMPHPPCSIIKLLPNEQCPSSLNQTSSTCVTLCSVTKIISILHLTNARFTYDKNPQKNDRLVV